MMVGLVNFDCVALPSKLANLHQQLVYVCYGAFGWRLLDGLAEQIPQWRIIEI